MRECEENGLVDLFMGGKDDEIAQKQNMLCASHVLVSPPSPLSKKGLFSSRKNLHFLLFFL